MLRKRVLYVYSCALLLALLACSAPAASTFQTGAATPVPATEEPGPDLIFHNGVILTMDANNTQAQAVAIQGGKVAAVGDDASVMVLKGSATQVIDLKGQTMLPGFIDTHTHLFQDGSRNSGMNEAQHLALENGVTSIGEMFVDEPFLQDLKTFATSGKLHIRTGMYLVWDTNCGDIVGDWYKAYPPDTMYGARLRVNGVKMFADGGSCKVPAVSFDYPNGVGHGDLFLTQNQLNQAVAEAQSAGYQVAIHALGDRAVEQSMNAIQAALAGNPNTSRHRIEHSAIVRPDMIPRFDQIGVVITIFGAYPTCALTGQGGIHLKFINPEKYLSWESPWRAILAANPKLHAAYYTDYPYFAINPLLQLSGFVTREQKLDDGTICKPPPDLASGAITVQQALRIMTIEGAYALRMDDITGSVETGKQADLIILSDNPLTVQPEALRDIQVLMTMIGGYVEHCAPGSEAVCPG